MAYTWRILQKQFLIQILLISKNKNKTFDNLTAFVAVCVIQNHVHIYQT